MIGEQDGRLLLCREATLAREREAVGYAGGEAHRLFFRSMYDTSAF